MDAATTHEPEWMRRMPEGARQAMARGEHPADPRRLGALIAVVGGVVFGFANGDGELPAGLLVALRAAIALLAVACVVLLFLRRRPMGPPAMPRRLAGLVYAASVVAMLGAIALGRAALDALGAAHAGPAWIAVCVGLHFLPFAWAFRERMLVRLGLAVAAVGAAGTVAGVLAGQPWGSAAAIAAGVVQLVTVAVWAARGR